MEELLRLKSSECRIKLMTKYAVEKKICLNDKKRFV